MKCFVCREAALEIRGSHGDCLDPQVLGTSCYGVLYAMARAGLTIDWCAIFWLITSNKIPGRGLWLIPLVATLPRLADRLTIMPGFILVLRREWCTNITHRGLGTGPNKVELTWILWRLSSRVSPSPSRNHATLRGHNNFLADSRAGKEPSRGFHKGLKKF